MKPDDKIERRGITTGANLWKNAKKKAGLIPMSALIRRLLEMYIEGEIKLKN